MSELAAFGLHSTCLPEEVSGPFDTYLELKAFINKHLPEKFYMEGDQRVDLAVVAGGCFRTLVWTTHFVRAVHGFLPV